MTKINQIYRCPICGNIVQVVHVGGGQLICCGQPMELLEPKFQDIGLEKHLPVIEKSENSITVKVGSVPHPMEEGHYIELIEVIADDIIYRKYLKPGQEPIAVFNITANNVVAREFCNIHGLWQSN
jgi:superoxide reductase